MGILWGYPGEVSNRYTHIWPVILSGSTYCHPLWVRHIGDHYTQYPSLWGLVMDGMETSISFDFT